MEQIDIEISGRVQGVYYRTTIANIANNLKLNGFVENKSDGTVHIVVQGTKDNLDEFLRWCQRGSFLSKVEGMSFRYKDIKQKFSKFEIKSKDGVIKDKVKGLANLGRRVTKSVVGKKDIVNVPKHIVIIPDGNRRWARQKNWHPWVGHLQVTKDKDKLLKIFKESIKLGIEYVTFWAFSTENWKRDDKEVNVLFNMMRKFYKEFSKQSKKYDINFKHIGRKDRLPKDIIETIDKLEAETKNNKTLHIQFALDYGGRDELIRAFQKMVKAGVVNIDEHVINEYLDTGVNVPDPDLIIRTGGEKRTSGVMIWQAHYAEMYFTNVLFPDFDDENLRMAVLDYSYRTRRFGGDSQDDFNNVDLKKLHEPEEQELANYALS